MVTTLDTGMRQVPPRIKMGVLFVVDQRPDVVNALRDDLVYRVPTVEVVSVASAGDIADALKGHLEYFGLLPTPMPAALEDALDTFSARYSRVEVLPRARKSAAAAAAFREPRFAMASMHALMRVSLDWRAAKQREPKRATHSLLHMSRWMALRSLIGSAQFDASNSTREFSWQCADKVFRDFGWHLKWSLGHQLTIDNHARIHWAEWWDGDIPRLCIGHCGEHL